MANEDLEKARIIKKALLIVDELAKLNINYILSNDNDYELDYEMLEKLIKDSKTLTRNPVWKLT